MYAETTWNIADLAAGAEASTDVTVPGAAMGDFVLASMGIDLEQGALLANVRAANTVEVTYINNSVDPSDLASTTLRVKVIPFDVI